MISSKLPGVATNIFTVMSKMAEQYDAINLSQGFPDFDVPSKLIELVYSNMRAGHNQYAPMQGVAKLRDQIAEKVEKLYATKLNPETEITVTAGGTQAIFTAITSFVREGDEVIMFEPAYDCYEPAVKLNGGKPVFIQLPPPNYQINWEEVKKNINARTRMIIINSPHNPSGAVLSEDDLKQLEKLIVGSKIILLSDEVYEHIIFDNKKHQSVLKFPNLLKSSLVVFSFGKVFHATGWKMGYIIAPEQYSKEFRKVHQFNVFSANTAVQYALAEFLKDEAHYLKLSEFYQEKRDYFLNLLSYTKLDFVPTPGTYFQVLDFSKLSDKTEVDFSKELTQKVGVASIPMSAFYHRPVDNKLLRFCFAKSKSTLEKAVERLVKI